MLDFSVPIVLRRNKDLSLTACHGRKPRISFVYCRLASSSTRLFSLPGIWPDGADGTDVNSVDRAKGKQLVATGDDFGNVNLYRYPSVSEKVRVYLRLFSFVRLFSYFVYCQVVLPLPFG